MGRAVRVKRIRNEKEKGEEGLRKLEDNLQGADHTGGRRENVFLKEPQRFSSCIWARGGWKKVQGYYFMGREKIRKGRVDLGFETGRMARKTSLEARTIKGKGGEDDPRTLLCEET